MMVTINLVGNVLICDDKNAVSIINPQTMKVITSVPVPTEGTYLYSAYFHSLSKTIYLGFENKRLIGLDSERYTNKSSMLMDYACLKFT